VLRAAVVACVARVVLARGAPPFTVAAAGVAVPANYARPVLRAAVVACVARVVLASIAPVLALASASPSGAAPMVAAVHPSAWVRLCTPRHDHTAPWCECPASAGAQGRVHAEGVDMRVATQWVPRTGGGGGPPPPPLLACASCSSAAAASTRTRRTPRRIFAPRACPGVAAARRGCQSPALRPQATAGLLLMKGPPLCSCPDEILHTLLWPTTVLRASYAPTPCTVA
jgi:hypothetical protein